MQHNLAAHRNIPGVRCVIERDAGQFTALAITTDEIDSRGMTYHPTLEAAQETVDRYARDLLAQVVIPGRERAIETAKERLTEARDALVDLSEVPRG